MPKKDYKNILKQIPEAIPPEFSVVDTLSKLKEEKTNEDSNKKIKLSFEFLDTQNKLFRLGGVENEWYADLIDELKMLTNITKKQLFGEYKKKYKPHPYTNTALLNYKDKYLINPQYEAIQLRLDKSSGRLHGFFVGNVYYVRFLDRWHNMYEAKGYPGIKISDIPLTTAEKLTLQIGEKDLHIKDLETKLYENVELLCDNCSDCPKGVFKKFKL